MLAPRLSLGSQLHYLEDPEGSLTPLDIIQNGAALKWERGNEKVLNFGLTESAYWFSASLSNPTSESVHKLVQLAYGLLDHVNFYLVYKGEIVDSLSTGDQYPIESREVYHRHSLFPIDVPATSEVQLLIRAQTSGALQVPLDLWDVYAFFEHEQIMLLIHLVFVGVVLALAIYNFFLFLAVRDWSYLWYVLSLLCISSVTLILQGLAFQFIWPNWPQLNNGSIVLATTTALVFSNIFAYTFLRLDRYGAVIKWTIRSVVVIGIALSLLTFVMPDGSLVMVASLLSVVAALFLFGTGVYVWRAGDVLARFYTVAWFILLGGSVLVPLSKIGFLPRHLLIEHAQQFGIVAEGLLLSFALAYRVNMERKKRYLAQAEVLQVQRKANDELEQRVRERTSELELANQKLMEVSSVDGLTQVKNRHFFEQTLTQEWSKSTRAAGEMSLLMIDGDYFKRVNDTYGHLCGDACLQHLAQIYEQSVTRAGDCVARYGGEEFAILLCHTTLDGAMLIGERVRCAVAETPFVWEGHTVSLTVSIGVASCIPERFEEARSLIKRADEALYAAKHAGRNRVVAYGSGGDNA
ncbi:diguanylate cyclase [Allohahella marinimesophila]|uniref:diguanylate cyclase n=1 Tax=Allohahella marinimesophila TaxID=1054972 RepID=A0ABP7NVW5_9GAMM